MSSTPIGLTEESFLPYGSLLHKSSKKPAHDDAVCTWEPGLYTYDFKGDITVGVLTGKKRELVLGHAERHVKTSEILVQLANDSVIYVAKASRDVPRKEDFQAFFLKQGEAIVLNEGVWHWIPYPAKEDCKTLVIYKNGTGAKDYEAQKLV